MSIPKWKQIKYIFMAFLLFCFCALTSCDEKNQMPQETYDITYIINQHGKQPENLADQVRLPNTFPILKEEGWNFGGWFIDNETFSEKAKEDTLLTSDIILYAKWEINKYIVTFDTDGGSTVAAITNVENGKKIEKPANPTKEGHTFDHWVKADGTAWNFDVDTVTANITLKATWTKDGGDTPEPEEKWIVTFDTDGGSAVEAITNVEDGSKITKPANPTKEGHTFDHWVKADGTAWNFDVDTVTANITLKAIWIKDSTPVEKFTVTFDTDGGSTVEAIADVESGSKITKPANPTKEGHTFDHWVKADGTAWNFDVDTVTADNRLYAKWIINKYIVTFDSTGGTEVSSIEVEYNNKIKEPIEPTREDYDFICWLYLEKKFDFDEGIKQNITLIAQWAFVGPQATIVYGNGEENSVLQAIKKNNIYYYEAPITPKFDNQVFAGWYVDETYTIGYRFDVEALDDLVLYAKWISWNDIFLPNIQEKRIMDFSLEDSTYTYEPGTIEDETLFAEIIAGKKNYRNYLDWFSKHPSYIYRFNEENLKCTKLILEQGEFNQDLRDKYYGFFQSNSTPPFYGSLGKAGETISIFFEDDWKIKYFMVQENYKYKKLDPYIKWFTSVGGYQIGNIETDSSDTRYLNRHYKPVFSVEGIIQSYFMDFEDLSFKIELEKGTVSCSVQTSYKHSLVTQSFYNGELQDHEDITYLSNCHIIANTNNMYPEHFDDIYFLTTLNGFWDIEKVWEIFENEALTVSNSLYPGKNKVKIRVMPE